MTDDDFDHEGLGAHFPIDITRTCLECQERWTSSASSASTTCIQCGADDNIVVNSISVPISNASPVVDTMIFLAERWIQTLPLIISVLKKAEWEIIQRNSDTIKLSPGCRKISLNNIKLWFASDSENLDVITHYFAYVIDVGDECAIEMIHSHSEPHDSNGQGLHPVIYEATALDFGLFWVYALRDLIRQIPSVEFSSNVTVAGDIRNLETAHNGNLDIENEEIDDTYALMEELDVDIKHVVPSSNPARYLINNRKK